MASAPQIRFTAGAVDQVRNRLAEEAGEVDDIYLRLSVVPGGCSGFEYALTVVEDTEEDDFIVEVDGLRLLVDPFSASYLDGLEIGFRDTFQSRGLTFDNPNATGSCGCGSSFSA